MIRIAATLGLLAAVGPVAIDMYLAALPGIARDLGTTVPATQATLTSFFVAFGLAQLIFGPWSDQVGRKMPLYTGVGLFAVASLGCMFAPSIEWLTAFRFMQGAGGAVVMVVPRAIIRDLYTGNDATRLMALVMLVISVSPMIAPLGGSFLILFWSWRAIFAVLLLLAAVSILMTRFALTETLPSKRRVPINLQSMMRGGRVLLTSRKFLTLTFVAAFGFASFISFISSAAFVYTEQFGLTSIQFSFAFAFNAIGFFSASQIAAPMGIRFGASRVIVTAVAGFAFFALSLLALALAGFANLPVIIGFLFLANACLGLVIPTAMVMALDDHGDIAGLASSLGGTLQMVTGGVMVTLASPFFDGTALPMITAIAACSVLALAVSRLAPRFEAPAE